MSQLVELVSNAKSAIESANDINTIEQIRVEYFGKKAILPCKWRLYVMFQLINGQP